MSKLEQSARQALSTDEALMTLELILRDGIEHGNWPLNKNCEDGLEAITALREALAGQAEQEQVGYVPQSVINWLSSNERTEGAYSSINLYKNPCGSSDAPLYSAPVRTKNLTDEELAKAAGFHELLPQELYIARAVIAAYKEKNK